jgi:hypothetical protein
VLAPLPVLSATGMLGSGFREESIQGAIERGVRMIGCDAGTTDFGPHLLATGKSQFSRAAVKRDTGVILSRAVAARIPLVIGSAGGAGGDLNLAWMQDIVLEIAREKGLHFKLAVIHSEQSKDTVRGLMRAGRVKALTPTADLTDDNIDQSLHIVAMMGAEPIQEALERADVVLAGRSSDAAIYSALPLKLGYPAAVCWHAGKILECGAAAVAQRAAPDSMVAVLRDDSFDVYPMRDDYRCTPQSIASHTLYENSDPFRLTEPSGVLGTLESRYVAVDRRTVNVSGSTFEPTSRYGVKIEGARLAGYSTIVLGAVRDPFIIRQLDSWLDRLDQNLKERLRSTVGPDARFEIGVRTYGKNGVMGDLEPQNTVEGHEVTLLWDVISDSQELSHSVAASLSHMAVHNPIPEWHGLISGVAFPFAPSEVDRGEVYEFNLNHVVFPDSPTSLFRTEHCEV